MPLVFSTCYENEIKFYKTLVFIIFPYNKRAIILFGRGIMNFSRLSVKIALWIVAYLLLFFIWKSFLHQWKTQFNIPVSLLMKSWHYLNDLLRLLPSSAIKILVEKRFIHILSRHIRSWDQVARLVPGYLNKQNTTRFREFLYMIQ